MAEMFVNAAATALNFSSNIRDFDKNMKALKRQVTLLSSQAEDIETTLMNMERGGKKKRKLEAKSWLEQVEEMKNEFETFNESITNGGLVEKVKFLGHVQTMREAVRELRDDGRNIGELTVDVDESTIPSLVVSQLSGKTSNDNLEKLYGWLEDDKVSSIGVYGMGGVGKTTLVKHIHNRILQKMPRVKVYWVTVSQDFSIKKLQHDIAKIAGLEFLEEDEEHRAAILHQHLVGKKTILILDDVWKCIHLEKLGNPHRIEGCKFIITSRSLEVCRQIECQELFKVKTLNENEAWDLFKENLLLHGHTVLTDTIEKHAKELAKKCGGLPLALNTVAASMRGVNDDHSWRTAAIKNFRNGSPQMGDRLENDVFEILKFSYNRLTDPRLKECFRYCCLYPEDHYIGKDEVIMKFFAEGLCEDTDEGHSILNKLVDVFLLERGEWYVKMHDLMREMALKISKFMVKSELIEIPEEQHWIPKLERVSFMRSEIKEIPDGFSPRCHNLSTLILQSYDFKDALQRFPESFLLYMTTQLQVLDLSYNRQLECLPNSISDLENLCGLFLRDCQSISCLPALEKLSALRVLDISGCSKISCLAAMKKLRALRVLNIEDCAGIRELPQDMDCLASLQYLYTMRTSILEISEVVISKLRNLRCLQLDNCGRFQSEEVNWLPHLQEFTNGYNELQSFNTTLVKKLEQLECYHISVGGRNFRELDCKRRTVYLEGISFKGERGNGIKVLLPANICCLHINRCEGLNGYIADYFQSIMSNLREVEVIDCNEVEWILNSEQITENAAASTTAFKSLEVLDLQRLPNLKSVCKGEDVILPDCTFSFLKHLRIYECDSMKKLLPQALLQNLQNLETLSVQYCDQLEVLIGVGDEEGIGSSSSSSNTPLLSSSNILYLPNLKNLQLDNLPALKSICNGREMICPSIQFIDIKECTNVKRIPSFLPINKATGQLYLPSSFERINLSSDEKEWWESLEWHNANAKDILQSHIHWSTIQEATQIMTGDLHCYRFHYYEEE